MVAQGDVCWAELPDPVGSAPGYRRPAVVVQTDAFNRSAIRTVVCVPLTSALKWAASPGNVELSPSATGLTRRSVANVSQIVTLDRTLLGPSVGHLPKDKLELVVAGVAIVIGRP